MHKGKNAVNKGLLKPCKGGFVKHFRGNSGFAKLFHSKMIRSEGKVVPLQVDTVLSCENRT